jgi:uncharacterized PurR-regulated membrane protein YhhQ (DUF165 family)
MRILLYIIAIVIANIVTATFAPVSIGMFLVPWGTFFIGATFILRDLVQNKYGRMTAYKVIGAALGISAVTSFILGDMLWIVFASAIAFLISETTDTEIYTRLKLPMSWKILYSGVVGGVLDSTVFVILGLSPIGANFVPWEFVPMAILGQVIVKTIMQMVGALTVGTIVTKLVKE